MISARVAAFVLAASHLVRSWVGTDLPHSLVLEIAEFRAEINRAEVTLRHTTAILDHCNSYTSFLTFVLKLAALSELLLCVWIVYLLTFRGSRHFHSDEPPQLCGPPVSAGLSSLSSSLGAEPSESPALVHRTRPTRPSDLKKLGQ